MTKIPYNLGETHPEYGTVTAAGVKDGEAYRLFIDEHGSVILMPLDRLLKKDDH